MPTYLAIGIATVWLGGFVWALVLYREPLRQEVDDRDIAYAELLGLLALIAIGWPLLLYSHYKHEWSSEADKGREVQKRV